MEKVRTLENKENLTICDDMGLSPCRVNQNVLSTDFINENLACIGFCRIEKSWKLEIYFVSIFATGNPVHQKVDCAGKVVKQF